MKQHILLQIPVPFGDPDFTLRDFFAAHALFLSANENLGLDDAVRDSYIVADMMMEQRKQKETK